MVRLPIPCLPGERGIRLAIRCDKLREARLEQGLTQEQLARLAGLTVATLCKIENGRQNPYTMTVYALEQALGVCLDSEPASPYHRRYWTGWNHGVYTGQGPVPR